MKKHLLTSFLFGTLTIVLCGIISGEPYRSIAWAVILVILIISVIAIGIATTAIYDLLKQGMNINIADYQWRNPLFRQKQGRQPRY